MGWLHYYDEDGNNCWIDGGINIGNAEEMCVVGSWGRGKGRGGETYVWMD